ncbi:MAG: DUF4139 domain-containing protein [Phycisphaerae bacterium]|nr:DUF4139 domain-containing protein [Phycisphaerae bacterium]
MSMSNHLIEDMLIKYAFDLAGEQEKAAAEAHLAGCEQCQSELERVRGRFRALDLLAGDITVSEQLAAQVIKQAGGNRQVKSRVWMPRAWMGLAAGVLVVASMLVVNRGWRDEEAIDKAVSLGIPAAAKEHFAAADLHPAPARPGVYGLAGAGAMARAADVTAGIDERPPFAPASAIELVVLPRRENVQLTIYNSADLTLVRERRNLTMKKGWNWLQFMWANTLIDPTSLSLEPMAHNGKIDVQQLVYPARLKDIGRWLIRSEVEGQVPFEITYFTSGLSWRAFYMGTLSADESTMHLEGYVRVDNRSGEEYEDAQTRLIVGRVNLLEQIAELAQRQHPYGSPVVISRGYGGGMMGGMGGMRMEKNRQYMWFDNRDKAGDLYDFDGDALEAIRKVEKEGLSEYFLYMIEGRDTIPNEWGKLLPSFEAADIPVENLYKYDETRWGTETVRFLSFANDTEHKLGETPLPDGSVKIYRQAGDDGSLAYTGGTDVKYIPVNEKVELVLGASQQVKVEPVLMDFGAASHQFDGKGNIDGWDEIHTWKLSVTNTREIPVKVEVFRDFATTYWNMERSGQLDAFEAEDMDTVKFTVLVPARTKREFAYKLRTYHGTREETWTKDRQ